MSSTKFTTWHSFRHEKSGRRSLFIFRARCSLGFHCKARKEADAIRMKLRLRDQVRPPLPSLYSSILPLHQILLPHFSIQPHSMESTQTLVTFRESFTWVSSNIIYWLFICLSDRLSSNRKICRTFTDYPPLSMIFAFPNTPPSTVFGFSRMR